MIDTIFYAFAAGVWCCVAIDRARDEKVAGAIRAALLTCLCIVVAILVAH